MQLNSIGKPFAWFGRWILDADQIRALGATLPRRDENSERAYRHAEMLVELARRVDEPVERLPAGSRPAAMMGLYRDAVYWALVSARGGGASATRSGDLQSLLAEFPRERAVHIAGDAGTLDAVTRSLAAAPPAGAPFETTKEEAGQARTFAEALLLDLDKPRRQLQKLRLRRWAKIAAVVAVVIAVVYGIYLLILGPNLLSGKGFRTSSSWAGCVTDSDCASLLFHTDPEYHPWIEFDLGKPTTFHRLEVNNRTDCCSDRAVPLLVEISNDHTKWTEIARKDADFSSWTTTFPSKTARYLKLHVPKTVAFHLKSVAIR